MALRSTDRNVKSSETNQEEIPLNQTIEDVSCL